MKVPGFVKTAAVGVAMALLPKVVDAATDIGSKVIDGFQKKAGEAIDKTVAPKAESPEPDVNVAELVEQNKQVLEQNAKMAEVMKQMAGSQGMEKVALVDGNEVGSAQSFKDNLSNGEKQQTAHVR